MKLVSVRFDYDGKWAVTLERQIVVSEGEVVDKLPLEFAHTVQDAGKGEIVDSEEEEDVKENNETTLFFYSELFKMKVTEIKDIADYYELPNANKDELIDSVLEAQVYSEEYLDLTEDSDVIAIGISKGLVEKDSDVEQVDVEELVKLILDGQAESEEK